MVETRHLKGPRVFDPTGIPLHADNQTVIKEKFQLDKGNRNVLYNEMTVQRTDTSRGRTRPSGLNPMSVIDTLNWRDVKRHYLQRVKIHHELLHLHENENVNPFAKLLLGITNDAGNYSAAEHALGPQILAMNGANAAKRVFDLASEFIPLVAGRDVPRIIMDARINFLKIGIGSEASCMVNPKVCWVANTRTIWTHLVLENAGNFRIANEALRLYRDKDRSSEMDYKIWSDIHRDLDTTMTQIDDEGKLLARRASVVPGKIKYIWADAIANALYAMHNE